VLSTTISVSSSAMPVRTMESLSFQIQQSKSLYSLNCRLKDLIMQHCDLPTHMLSIYQCSLTI